MNRSIAVLLAAAPLACYTIGPAPAAVAPRDGGGAPAEDAAAVDAGVEADAAADAGAGLGEDDAGAAIDSGTGSSTGSPGEEELRNLFEQTVAPVLDAKCRGCHGPAGPGSPKFLGNSLAQHYDVIRAHRVEVLANFDKESASLIGVIVPGPHFGEPYRPEEVTAIGVWLDAEKTAAETGPRPITPLERAFAEWSGCMDLATWDQLGVAVAWARLESDEGPCIRCHINGQAEFLATDDSRRMFEVLSTRVEYMSKYFAANITDPANVVIETNLPAIRAVGLRTPPHTQHPEYEAGPETEAAQALEAFYSATVARKQANQCGPSRLITVME